MTPSFGWTKDPALLAILEELLCTGDDILSDRKCGGVHRVWVWPLGHPDAFDFNDAGTNEPIFTRVDVAYGRYLKDGCTFLVWDYDQGGDAVRAGTLSDADWLRRGLNEDTERAKKLAAMQKEQEKAQRYAATHPPTLPQLPVPPYRLAPKKDTP
jgi:hypothetical protein